MLDHLDKLFNDYETTILAIESFIHFLTWDDENGGYKNSANSSIGRRMTTTDSNRVSFDVDVTPDIVIQIGDDVGYVAEVKNNLSRVEKSWLRHIEQLERYDDRLFGWWTEDGQISDSCVVLMVHYLRSRSFIDFLDQNLADRHMVFSSPVSIIEYNRVDQVNSFISLRIEWGDILDTTVKSELREGTAIPIEKLLASRSIRKFYDSPPPIEYTMSILWQNIFTPMISEERLNRESRTYSLPVNLDKITNELRSTYGSASRIERDVSFPRRKSVRDAMDAFVSIGLATQPDNDNYTVHFKKLQDPLRKFSKVRDKNGATGDDRYKQLGIDY